MSLCFTLNGRSVAVDAREGESLLEVLRERCGILSTKDGCRPQGQCGCCLALVDGRALVTCAVPAAKAEGKEVLTLEGLPEREREILAQAFVSAAALQCGFCIPGFALKAKHLIDRNPDPSRAEIAQAVDGNLCRCTGYTKILDAIELAAAAYRGETIPEPLADGGVGARLARYQGRELTLGDRAYVDDMLPAGLLRGAVVLSEHARARVSRIDTSRARAMPGVVCVATAEDVPGKRWYGLILDDWPGLVAEGEEVRCVGDVLACVAAVDEHTAREAARRIEVTYEVLEPVLDPHAAAREGAPQVRSRCTTRSAATPKAT